MSSALYTHSIEKAVHSCRYPILIAQENGHRQSYRPMVEMNYALWVCKSDHNVEKDHETYENGIKSPSFHQDYNVCNPAKNSQN